MIDLSIIVPTYNERENVAPLVQTAREALAGLTFEVIFVDDASPDGTAQAVRELAAADPRVRLVERPAKLGLASAVLQGLEASRGGAVAMMDADLSHNPTYLPRLLTALEEADVAVGSRYVKGGGIRGWSWWRRLASLVACWLARLTLGVPVKDATSGFVLFRREALEGIKGSLSPRGFKLLLEVLVKAPQLRVAEVPYTFAERARGRSKMSTREMLTFFTLCWELRRWRRKHPTR